MSVTHRHGQHPEHMHTDEDYALHQPMDNEIVVRVDASLGLRPNLGLATTRQMLEELVARGEKLGNNDVDALGMVYQARQGLTLLPERMLNYRTADESRLRPSTPADPERQAKREAGA